MKKYVYVQPYRPFGLVTHMLQKSRKKRLYKHMENMNPYNANSV